MDRAERLFERAEAISEGRANGLCTPIFRHLAQRGHGRAMLALAGAFSSGNDRDDLGSAARTGDPAWTYRRLWRTGGPDAWLAAQNIAASLFNCGDLQGYRLWLRRAARLGDRDAGQELRRFETRLPHTAAHAIRRGRPYRHDGS